MKANADSPTPGPKKFFDVMRPGKATPPATSRPVIVGHQPQVRDDISGISPRAADPNEQRSLMDAKSRVTVQPTGTLNSSSDATLSPEVRLGGTAVGSEASEPPAEQPSQAPMTETTEPVEAQPVPSVHDPVISAAMKDLDTTVSETAAPHTKENIIVSHHKGGFRFGRFLLILLAVAALGAAIMNFLLDFGILNPDSGLPHTDFFDNSNSRVD